MPFTCFGAGDNLNQCQLPDTDWRECPDIAQDIPLAFYKLKELCELIFVLKLTHPPCPDGSKRENDGRRINALKPLTALELKPRQALDLEQMRRNN